MYLQQDDKTDQDHHCRIRGRSNDHQYRQTGHTRGRGSTTRGVRTIPHSNRDDADLLRMHMGLQHTRGSQRMPDRNDSGPSKLKRTHT